MKKERKRRSGNYTSNPCLVMTSLHLEVLLTARLLPGLTCIQRLTNIKLQACYSIYKLGLDVRMSNINQQNIQDTIIWDKKSNSFINNTMIIPLQSNTTTISVNLVQAPLHQAPSAPFYKLLLSTL
jgi:hypothetical protein